jgi:hypothetical protein
VSLETQLGATLRELRDALGGRTRASLEIHLEGEIE